MSFKFIDENPLHEHSKLEFGHQEMVTTLRAIVAGQRQNLTIGLFGGWGTGKSSIVESLKQELRADQIPLVVFDVWKHEGDALRRTFIKSCVEQLSAAPYGKEIFNANFSSSIRLESSGQLSSEKFKIHWPTLWKRLLLAVCGIVVMFLAGLILLGLLKACGVDLLDDINVKGIFGLATAATTASLFFKYADGAVKIEKKDVKEERFQDPYEFEGEFSRIAENLCNPVKKMVITFDNLDRVSGDSALQIISTVKTFLDLKRNSADAPTVVFLIPCDVVSMKRHIAKTLQKGDTGGIEESQYIDEFLRKFFNTSLWIPDFHHVELESFAFRKLGETGIAEFNNESLAWLIIKVFHRNPRQIVQFINLLISNYLLFKEISSNSGLGDPYFYRDNVPQLAKFLLIRQRHPEELELHREHNHVQLGLTGALAERMSEEFKELLQLTGHIFIPNLEPFFKGRMTIEQQRNPEFVKLINMMRLDETGINEYLDTLMLDGHEMVIDKLLKAEFAKILLTIQKDVFIGHIFQLSKKMDSFFSSGLYRDIITYLLSRAELTSFLRIDPILMREELFEKPNGPALAGIIIADRINIVERYIDSLVKTMDADYTEKNHISHLVQRRARILEFIALEKNYLNNASKLRLTSLIERDVMVLEKVNLSFMPMEDQHFFFTDAFKESISSGETSDMNTSNFIVRMEVLDQLLPIEDYSSIILDMVASSMFHTPKNIPAELDDNWKRYVHVLKKRLNVVNQSDPVGIPEPLLVMLAEYLKTLSPHQLGDWHSELIIMLDFKDVRADAVRLLSDYIEIADPSSIALLMNLAGGMENIIGQSKELMNAYLTHLLKQRYQDFIWEQIPRSAQVGLLQRYIESDWFREAGELIIRLRDVLDRAEIIKLAEAIVAEIRLSIGYPTTFDRIREIMGLIRLLVDKHEDALWEVGFWKLVVEMLQNTLPEGVDIYAYQFLTERIVGLPQPEISRIYEEMFSVLKINSDLEHAYLYESILKVLEASGEKSHQVEFFKLSFNQILLHTKSNNAVLAIAQCIVLLKPDFSDFSQELNHFTSRANLMPLVNLQRLLPVFEAIRNAVDGNLPAPLDHGFRSRIETLCQRAKHF